MNQGAQADSPGTPYNPADPNAGPAVNGRIQNTDGGYQGGWIGNHTTNPGHVQHQMVVAWEVLARYGDAADKSAGAGVAPAFAPVAELYLSAPGSALHEGNADPVAHTVVQGETLQSIARSTLGDSRLWYRIAQANGLSVQPDAPLQAGVTLSIPKSTLNANSASTFKPYDPSSVIGDANPALSALPIPQGEDGGCGDLGPILQLVIAAAVAVFAPELLPELFAAIGEVGGAAAVAASAAAIGDVAGQAFANIIGIQDGFNWKELAFAALSAGVGKGLGGSGLLPDLQNPIGNAILQRAVGNALTQGVAVAIGLQDQFSWKAVAFAGITAGVGQVVGAAIGDTFGETGAGRFATNFVKGAVGSLVANAAVGGHVSGQRVLMDGFGQALSAGLRDAGTQEDRLGGFMAQQDAAQAQRDTLALQGVFRQSEIAQQNTQALSDALYGWSGNGEGIGLKPVGTVGLRFGGKMQTPDDTRVVREFDPDNRFNIDALVPTGRDGQLTAQVGFLINPATAGGVVGGGYQPIRPNGVGGPPGYDIRTDMPTSTPGFSRADPNLGLGAPPLQGETRSWKDFLTGGLPPFPRALVNALDGLVFSKGDSTDLTTATPRGGAHGDVKGVAGYESHHMPADSVSPLPTNRGPAISMEVDDHRQTASWGSSREAREYRATQARLIDGGNFQAAQDMDARDLQSKFGQKYNQAIDQLRKYTEQLGIGKK